MSPLHQWHLAGRLQAKRSWLSPMLWPRCLQRMISPAPSGVQDSSTAPLVLPGCLPQHAAGPPWSSLRRHDAARARALPKGPATHQRRLACTSWTRPYCLSSRSGVACSCSKRPCCPSSMRELACRCSLLCCCPSSTSGLAWGGLSQCRCLSLGNERLQMETTQGAILETRPHFRTAAFRRCSEVAAPSFLLWASCSADWNWH
mmetsp:Transcript_25789/g.64979  ORF Transcript_25789/g.64979 Transcript_25789/m.64979 type:complete len:203 (+) Transcript_25789:118-726(+)